MQLPIEKFSVDCGEYTMQHCMVFFVSFGCRFKRIALESIQIDDIGAGFEGGGDCDSLVWRRSAGFVYVFFFNYWFMTFLVEAGCSQCPRDSLKFRYQPFNRHPVMLPADHSSSFEVTTNSKMNFHFSRPPREICPSFKQSNVPHRVLFPISFPLSVALMAKVTRIHLQCLG